MEIEWFAINFDFLSIRGTQRMDTEFVITNEVSEILIIGNRRSFLFE